MPRAKDHSNYAVLTLLTFIMPFVGLICGVVYILKDGPADRKLGEHLIAFSVLAGFLWTVLYSLFLIGLG